MGVPKRLTEMQQKFANLLVTNEGISNKALEVGRLITTVNKARLIVGRPSPIMPLTIPAKRKVPKMMITVDGSNIYGWFG